MKTISSLCLISLSALLFAGGPIVRNPDGSPSAHPTSVPLTYSIDAGNLSANWSRDSIIPLIQDEFAEWDAVPGSPLRIQQGTGQTTDITTLAQINAALSRGENPIVFDETDSIYTELGFDPNTVLAFAGPNGGGDGQPYQGMIAVLGGTGSGNSPSSRLRATILHEFGHALGLGHSQVNGYLLQGTNVFYEDFPRPSSSSVEIMYWQAIGSGSSLLIDDISGYLALYGLGETGTANHGAIRGKVFLSDGVTPADGINVTVRDLSGGVDTVYTNAASVITCCNGSGDFNIPGLPPGSYSVEVRDIITTTGERNASYSDPIRTNRTTASTSLGPFPGDPEFYNGNDESTNPVTDDPTQKVTLTVGPNSVVSGINILFNRAIGDKGTALPLSWQIPDVQADSATRDTMVAIVNPAGAAATISLHGFNANGDEFSPTGVPASIPARGKFTGSVREMFSDPSAIDWIQVGSTNQLYVFAEFQTATVRSAYWASEGLESSLIMPHVAKNTSKFDNFVSVVNAQGEASNTQVTAQPGNNSAAIDQHAVGYTQVRSDLQDLFGADLNPVDWARVTSDKSAVAAMEYFTTLPDNSQMAALDLNSESGKSLQFLHIATNTSLFWTGLVYINVSGVSVTATETFYNASGEVIKTNTVPLAPGQKETLLFDANNQVRVPSGSSWMEVTVPEASNAELVGYELFGSASAEVQDVFAGLQGNYSSGKTLDYPHFFVDNSHFTAIVATNLGDETANLEISAIAADGTILGTVTEAGIPPKQKITRLMKGLFSDQNILDNAAWIRAEASGSTWAGFLLWGDEVGVRQHLSGMVARSGGGPNNSYETAIELTPGINGVWDLNYVTSIEQDGATGPLINTCCSPRDGIEEVFKIVLTEGKDLLIAVAPDGLQADLDLFVVNSELTSRNFFVQDMPFNDQIDYSASAGGVESVARHFEAGTYYILVTLFEGDTFSSANFTLQVTEKPLVLGTFQNSADLTSWPLAVLGSDTDGAASWTYDTGFRNEKYGAALRQIGVAGQTESSALLTPTFHLPTTGVTIFDFDFAAVTPTAATGTELVQPFWGDPGLTTLDPAAPTIGGIGFVANSLGTSYPYNGGTISLIGWSRWITQVSAIGFAALGDDFIPEDFTPPAALLGEDVVLVLACTNDGNDMMLDNIRVYNMPVQNTKAKFLNAADLKGKAKPEPRLVQRRDLKKLVEVLKLATIK